MGMFDIFKSKEEKEKIALEKQKELERKLYLESLPQCEMCQGAIEEEAGERKRTFGGKVMHLECFRDMRKQAKEMWRKGELH